MYSMTKKKRNQLNRLAVFTLLFFVGFGSLLIHRAKLPLSELIQIKEPLIGIDMIDGIGKYGRNYAVGLTIENVDTKYGVYAGTKEQAKKTLTSFDVTINQEYTFYVDPTVGNTVNGVNLGLRLIKNGEEIIFQESMKAHYGFGAIMISLGLIGSLSFYLIGKKKFG